MIVKNPDKKRVYNIWHYCVVCGRAWTHSQGELDEMKRHECVRVYGWEVIKTVPTTVDEVEVGK